MTIPPSTVPPAQPARPWRAVLQRWQRRYVFVAVVSCNALLGYVLLNLVLGGLFAWRDARSTANPVTQTYGAQLDAVYPDLPEPQRSQMLAECWNRPYQHADYIHFSEQPFQGQHVNVTAEGYRSTRQPLPWPPDPERFTIFCFGGSTLFGYGLPDEQTIPAQLERLLQAEQRPVSVYNFAVGWHYSTQERIRFEQLLVAGSVPDVAVFVDGVNDATLAAEDRPAFAPQFAEAFRQVQGFGVQSPTRQTVGVSGRLWEGLVGNWPVGRLARRLSPGWFEGRTSVSQAADPPQLELAQLQKGVSVLLTNRRLISAAAAASNVRVLFVIQPAPGASQQPPHAFANENLRAGEAAFYRRLSKSEARRAVTAPTSSLVLNLADLESRHAGPWYVDVCHYSASFSGHIAREIAQFGKSHELWQSQKRE